MVKGTPSMGKRHKIMHIHCRRCGRRAFHAQKSICAACGYGRSSKMNRYNWKVKKIHGLRLR